MLTINLFLKLALLIVSAALSLLVAFVWVDSETGFDLLRHLGPHFLFLLLLAYVAVVSLLLRRHLPETPRPGAVVLAILVAAIAFTVTREAPGFKVVQDDVVLSVIAQNIHLNRTQEVPMSGHRVDGSYELGEGYLDKRAGLYPLLVAIVHDVTGYRISNAFYLNMLLSVFVLILLYAVVHAASGSERAGLFSVVLFAAVPLLASNATGAGFEVLNLLLMLAVLITAMLYWRQPGALTMSALCLSAVLLTYVRYESGIFIGLVAITIVLSWWRERQVTVPWFLLAVPWLMVPAVFQLNVSLENELLWQLDSAERPFGPEYLSNNIGAAVAYFTSFAARLSNNPITFILGSVAAVWFLAISLTRTRAWVRDKKPEVIVLFMLLLVGIQLLLVMSFFAGNLGAPSTTRYALPVFMMISLVAGVASVKLLDNNKLAAVASVIVIVGVFAFTLPSVAKQEYVHATGFNYRTDKVIDYYESLDSGHYLLIDPQPWVYLLHEIPVAQLDVVNQSPWKLAFHLNNGTFNQILITQDLINPMELPEFAGFGSRISSQFETKRVHEWHHGPFQLTAINQLLTVKPAQLQPPSETGQASQPVNVGPQQSFRTLQLDPRQIDLWYEMLP